MLAFEPVPIVSEPCCPADCAYGLCDIFQISSKTRKDMAKQRFEPGPTAWEFLVLTLLPKQKFHCLLRRKYTEETEKNDPPESKIFLHF